MSQTDSLEEHQILPKPDSELPSSPPQQLQALAQQLDISVAGLEAALAHIERLTPVSGRVCLRLLRGLSLETEGWKTGPHAQHLQLLLYSVLSGGNWPAEVYALLQALQQLYPELFELEPPHD